MALAINGTPTTKIFTGGSSTTLNVTTTVANCIIVLVVNMEKSATAVQTVTSVSDVAGLTWARRSSQTEPNQQNIEVWWARATGILTGDTITVNFSATPDNGTAIVFGVSGCNMTSPWDPNVSIPKGAFANASGAATVTGVSTTFPNTMLLGFVSNRNGPSYAGKAGSGYTMVANVDNGGGVRFDDTGVQQKVVAVAQSGVTVSFGLTSNVDWIMIADALTSDADNRSAVAAQTIPTFTKTQTAKAIDKLAQAKTIAPFTQSLGTGARPRAVAVQNIPVFTQTVTARLPRVIVAGHVIPAFTQTFRATAKSHVVASQTINAFTVHQTLHHGARIPKVPFGVMGGGARPRRPR